MPEASEPIAYHSAAPPVSSAPLWTLAAINMLLSLVLTFAQALGFGSKYVIQWAIGFTHYFWAGAAVGIGCLAVAPLCGFMLGVIAWMKIRRRNASWIVRVLLVLSLILNGVELVGLLLIMPLLMLLVA